MAKFSTLVDKDGNIIYPQTSIKQVYINNETTIENKIETIENSIAEAGGVPSGLICMWSGDVVPSGWSLCNGKNGTPDLRDRFIVGSGNEYMIGDTGGEKTHTLTVNEMPSHNHTYLEPNKMLGTAQKTSASDYYENTVSTNTSSTGGGQAHENRPPYYALAFIMKN